MEKDDQKSQIVIYQAPSGESKIEARFDSDTEIGSNRVRSCILNFVKRVI